jgi:hypothetical protein
MDELASDRADAFRTISAAFAGDRISLAQFEERLGLIRQAPNRASIDAIIADLVPSGGVAVPAGLVPVATDHTAVVRPADHLPAPADVLRIRTIMGSTKRAGAWTVPFRLELKVVLGELVIDLRDAIFWSDVLDIELDAALANVTLIVPAGTQVENQSEERFSSSSHSTRSTRGLAPFGLLIRITGSVRFSNLEIKERPPTPDEPKKPKGLLKLLGG